jgi:hypothetical protein
VAVSWCPQGIIVPEQEQWGIEIPGFKIETWDFRQMDTGSQI